MLQGKSFKFRQDVLAKYQRDLFYGYISVVHWPSLREDWRRRLLNLYWTYTEQYTNLVTFSTSIFTQAAYSAGYTFLFR